MQITLEYQAQLKRAAEMSRETVTTAEGVSLADLLAQVCNNHNSTFRQMVLGDDNTLQPALLLFRGDQQLSVTDPVPLSDGDVITLLTPISGG